MPSRNKKKKKGKKGGKKDAWTAAPANPHPGDASLQIEPPTGTVDGRADAPARLSRRERKDRKLVARSMTLIPSSKPLLRRAVPLVKLSDSLKLNVIGPDGESVVQGNASILRCKKAKDAYAIVKEHEGTLDEMLAIVSTFFSASRWTECELSASRVLDAIDRALSHLLTSDDETEKLIFVHSLQILANFYRCWARFRLEDDEGTISDATEMFALIPAWESDCDKGRWFSEGQIVATILHKRGMSLFKLGKNKEAVADLRAACALCRLRKENVNELKAVRDDCIEQILWMKACQKVIASAPRPHYSRKQADRIEKELGIGVFAEEKYHCIGCGVKPSDSVQLFACGRCENVWLCGKECQTKSWDEHKQCCVSPVFLLKGELKDDVEASITNDGCATVTCDDGSFRIVCRDKTGQLFNSLSNEDVNYDVP